ncbi:MAG TPA: type IV pilus assembly protein PilM [Thermoanaerobacterales bacterium]|nr:type IV pilus assembly protein PilM [Thermoanaerobacterales bacterium]
MFGVGNKILGLDIGSSIIKWIVYSEDKNMPLVYNWGFEKTPYGAVKNGRIFERQILLTKLKEIIVNNGIKVNKASITLSCPEMIIRTVTIPKLKQREIQNVVRFEAEQFIPGNSDEYIIDYKIYGETKENQNDLLKTLIVALPSGIVQNYIELLEDLSIKPLAVDFNGNSACRFLNLFLKNIRDKDYVLIDMGASNTIITIAERGVPVLTRLVQIGSEEMVRTVANSFNLNLEDGEKYIKTHGRVFLDNEQPEDKILWEMMTSIMPTVELLLKDIFQSLEFYKSMTKKSIDTTLMIGGGSYLKNIDKYVAQQLSMNILPLKGIFPLKMKKEMQADIVSLFCNVLGLAFREGE